MGDDTNSGPTGEQPTAADLDQGGLAQLKRQLGELTAGELDLTEVQVINLSAAIGPEATARLGDLVAPHLPGNLSGDARLLDVTGQVVTAGNGAVRFLLSSFLGVTRLLVLAPVHLVATPCSTRPVSVTTQYRLVPDPAVLGASTDLEITLLAWSSGGSPAPEVVIDWRCRLVGCGILL